MGVADVWSRVTGKANDQGSVRTLVQSGVRVRVFTTVDPAIATRMIVFNR